MFEIGTQLTFRDSDKKIIYFLSGHLGGHQGRIDLFDIQGKLLAEARQKSLGFFQNLYFWKMAIMLVLLEGIMVLIMICYS